MTKDFSQTWVDTIREVLATGQQVQPRGQLTMELPQHTLTVDMRRPVLLAVERKLNYQFMAAEAYWILSGDDKVSGIAPYNGRIAQFSDDGEKFFGAYGPKIHGQLDYVVGKLREDPASRQAGLTIWRENPGPTKDVPCTVAIFFSVRNRQLHSHVFMRSSDIWLGVPYDVFNFSMLAHFVCGKLNEWLPIDQGYSPGQLYLTAASSHLYESNWADARQCLHGRIRPQPLTDKLLWNDHDHLMAYLGDLRNTKPGHELRWWDHATN